MRENPISVEAFVTACFSTGCTKGHRPDFVSVARPGVAIVLHDAASACISKAQALFHNVLRDATEHNEQSMNVIFARHPDMQTSFSDLFRDSSTKFAQASQPPPTKSSMSLTVAKALEELKRKRKAKTQDSAQITIKEKKTQLKVCFHQ